MKKLIVALATAITLASLVLPDQGAAQVLPPAKRARRIRIVKAPEIKLAVSHLTIIRWTTNNPGGSDVHYGIVHYGTDPEKLTRTARNPIRLNQGHPTTTYRVRLDNLEPRTTYYYRVDSEESGGRSDRVKSPIRKFTTAAPGERISADPRSG